MSVVPDQTRPVREEDAFDAARVYAFLTQPIAGL